MDEEQVLPDGVRSPAGSRRRRALRSLRSPSLWISLAVAVGLVFTAVPRRQEPSRISTEARLGMRTLTPLEAATLLAAGEARLSRIGGETVDLVTRRYLVPIPAEKLDPASYAEAAKYRQMTTYRGRPWRMPEAGWKRYYLRYRVERGPLERELAGRPLAAFHDPAVAAKPISFDSERLAFYAVCEVALLWVTFVLLWAIVRRVRPLLLPPALLLLLCAYLVAVALFSPAHFDADAFFQRWVVEEGFFYLLVLASALVPVTPVCLLVLLHERLSQRTRRPAGRPDVGIREA